LEEAKPDLTSESFPGFSKPPLETRGVAEEGDHV